jgi:glycosyltransferase involved in cell wall biosynthesis
MRFLLGKLSIIIPVYNEAKTIDEVLKRVSAVVLPPGIEREIIVVDDGSTDGTREVLKNYQDRFRIIFRAKNNGKGAALKEGFKVATGDYVLIQDADLEYDPNDYPALIKPVLTGKADIVFGSRVLQKNNVPFSRFYFYGGLVITKIFNFFFGARLTDVATCYKLFPSRLIPTARRLPSNDFVYDVIELSHLFVKTGAVLEVPITYAARSNQQGKKLNWRHGVRCLLAMLRLQWNIDTLIRRLRYKRVVNLVKENAVILDIGCGPQLAFLETVRDKIRFGFGVDKKIQEWKSQNLSALTLNLDENPTLPFTNEFIDQAFLLAVLEHFTDPQAVLREILRVIKKDGEIILTTPTPAAKPVLEFIAFRLGIIDGAEIQDHKRYFSRQDLVSLLSAVGFRDTRHRHFELGFNQLAIAKK